MGSASARNVLHSQSSAAQAPAPFERMQQHHFPPPAGAYMHACAGGGRASSCACLGAARAAACLPASTATPFTTCTASVPVGGMSAGHLSSGTSLKGWPLYCAQLHEAPPLAAARSSKDSASCTQHAWHGHVECVHVSSAASLSPCTASCSVHAGLEQEAPARVHVQLLAQSSHGMPGYRDASVRRLGP